MNTDDKLTDGGTVNEGAMSDIATQPNERRCETMTEEHRFELPQCCPITKNPQPGSFIRIWYRPNDLILEVESLAKYIGEYVGGRGDVRSMEGMVQNIAQDCADAVKATVMVRAKLFLLPAQQMKLKCVASCK